uniref:Uncharacterized protein n=1 Tax=Anopheles braziliensis TaxID=58242 RepID=A0A2M3ZLE3_9DIPT
MEQVGVLGKLLTQLVVLLLAVHFLRQLGITLLDDFLQVAPGILERLHREPGVRVRADFEALNLTIQCGQRLEVNLGGGQRSLERRMSLSQCLDLFDRVTAHRIGQILFGVLEPRVKRRSLLGEGKEQILDLTELILNVKQAVLAGYRILAQLLPARQHIFVTLQNGCRLCVVGADQLILQYSDVMDAFLFKRRETSIECLLLGEQRLNGRQVTTKLFRLDVVLLVRNPTLDHIGLPHELQIGKVVQQCCLATRGQSLQILQLLVQLHATLRNAIAMVVVVRNQRLAIITDVRAAITVSRKVGLECVMFLQQTLYGSHRITVVFHRQQLLLLGDPGLFLFDLRQELLVDQRFVQLLTTGGRQSLQLGPSLVESLQTLLDLWHTQVRHIHQLLACFLYRLDGGLMRRQFRLETLVLLLQILHTGQITSVIIRTDQQLLLLDPALLIGDITEELMQRVRLVQPSLTMSSQITDTFVALINRLTLLLDAGTIELAALNERIRLPIHILDAILVRMDVGLHQLVLLHQILHRSQILAGIFRSQQTLDLTQPKVQILHRRNVRALLVRFLQLQRFFGRLLRQVLPLVSDLRQPLLNGFLRTAALITIDQVATHRQHTLNTIGIGCQLGLERLMLLVFRLNVGRILVAFLRRQLQLLCDPVFDFIRIARELLQRLLITEPGSLLDQILLQMTPAVQHFLTLIVDQLARVVLLGDQLISQHLERTNLLLMSIDRLIEVLVLLD